MFMQLAWHYMSRRKMRTFLTTLAILFGVLVIFSTWTALPAMERLMEAGLAQQQGIANTTVESANDDLRLVYVILGSFGGIAFFVGGFVIFNTFRTIIVERQRDLALLRTIGAEHHQIMRLILVEAFLQGVIGTILGLLLGWLFAWLMMLWIYETNSVPTLTSRPTVPSPNLVALLVASTLGIGTSLLSAYLPAQRATKISPLAALRPSTIEAEQQSTRRNLILGLSSLVLGLIFFFMGKNFTSLSAPLLFFSAVLLTPPLIPLYLALIVPVLRRIFPQAIDLANASILQQRGRAATTTNSIVMAVAAFIACASLVIALQDLFFRLYTFAFVSDYIVLDVANLTRITNGASDGSISLAPDVVTSLRADANVSALTSARLGIVPYEGVNLRLIGIEPEYSAELRPLYFSPTKGNFTTVINALSAGRSIVISSLVAVDFGLGLGDIMAMTSTDGTIQNYEVVGITEDYLYTAGYGGIISQAALAQDFGVTGDMLVYLKLADTSNVASLRAVLSPNHILVNLIEFRDKSIQEASSMMSAFYFLGAVVVIPALLGLVNTLMISILERQRELGTLRALGAGRGQIRQMVLVEVSLLAILGISIGAALGLALSMSLLGFLGRAEGQNVDELYFVFPTIALILAFLMGFALIWLTSFFPANRAAHQNIVAALRYE